MFNFESEESEVVETWQRFVQGLLGVLALAGAGLMAHYYAPPETSGLEQQVHQLSRQVADLEREQSFSSAAVDEARESVAYIYGIYHVSGRSQGFRARVSGTGFVVAPGLLATNRHVAEPWYGDREVAVALRQGGSPVLEKLVAYFPGSPIPVKLETVAVANQGDLAALSRIRPSATFGHIGDVTGDKLIYDAPTARGGSGGPVLNLRGEVVGINSAYIDGFSGGTLGITAAELRPLLETARKVPVSQFPVLTQN